MAKFIVDDKKLNQIIKATSPKAHPWVIHDGVEYGIFQEFSTASGGKPRREGGRTGKGHPSLIPAFEKVTKDLPEAIGQAVEKAINLNDILEKAARDIQDLWADDVNVDTGAYKNSITAGKDVSNLT